VADVHVLVVFYSRHGRTEALALAAGLGAIQARADIRLRRVADRPDPRDIEADPQWARTLERMHKDYIAPRPDDVAWADVLVLATPSDQPDALLEYVAGLRTAGSVTGKLAAPIVADDVSVLDRLGEGCAAAAMTVAKEAARRVADAATARALGREMVEVIRARRRSTRS
jgi:hypothetical protein